MPVSIDEVTAEVEPGSGQAQTTDAPVAADLPPEVRLRRHRDMDDRVACRAERVRAD